MLWCLFIKQAGSGLWFAAEGAGGARFGRQALQESSEGIGDTRRCSTVMDGNQSRGGDTSTREAESCRAHSRISGIML